MGTVTSLASHQTGESYGKNSVDNLSRFRIVEVGGRINRGRSINFDRLAANRINRGQSTNLDRLVAWIKK